MLNTKLNNSIKPRLYSINIDCSMLRTINLTSLDTLDLRMSYTELISPLFTN
jgi:hypothetical protein